jgi:hypothetical protein
MQCIIAHTLAAISVGAHTLKVQIALRSSRDEMAKLLQVLSSCTSIMVFGIVRNEMKGRYHLKIESEPR